MDAVHESEVLKQLDASVKDLEDSWPQFPLRDVSVVSQASGQQVSLLKAHKKGKVRVIGILHDQDADEDSRKRFKKRFQRQQRVYIKDVDMYSYGKYEDGSLAFWAAGEAGWFELRTQSAAYKPVYAQMEEATEILYFAVGRTSTMRKSWKKSTEKQVIDIMRQHFVVFLSSDLNKQRKDLTDAMDAFTEHRHFLIKCMLEGAEGIDWEDTPFFHWFRFKFPGDFNVIAGIVNQTSDATLEDLTTLAPPVRRARRNTKEKETNEDESYKMNVDKPANTTTARRSKRLAAEDGNSSDDLTLHRGSARGQHKRKSMLRPPGSAKTPKKSPFVRRVDAPSSVRDPQMEYFREMRRLDDLEAPYPKPKLEEETALPNSLVHDLKYTNLSEKEETLAINDDYWEVKGPDDTWACPLDGCNHQVWEATSVEGKAMIKAHYAQTHQDSIEELIRSESRPWAKTNYLLEKVRSMKQIEANGGEVNEDDRIKGKGRKGRDEDLVFPKPIKRMLR